MRDIIEKVLNKLFSCSKNENFFGGALKNNLALSTGQTISVVLSIVIVQIILLFAGKYLWNNYLVQAVKIVNPIDNVWTLLAVSVLLKLLL